MMLSRLPQTWLVVFKGFTIIFKPHESIITKHTATPHLLQHRQPLRVKGQNDDILLDRSAVLKAFQIHCGYEGKCKDQSHAK